MANQSGAESETADQRGGDTPQAVATTETTTAILLFIQRRLVRHFGPYDDWWYGSARNSGYYLFSQPMSTPPGPRINLEEQLHHETLKLFNLASYNYLGLSTHPEVIAAAHAALDKYGLGAAGSPILSGTMDVHLTLEKELAAFKHKEAAMVFPTGYSTNVGLLSALMRPGDWVILDQNVHASIVDGAILAKAQVKFFRHNQPADLGEEAEGHHRQTPGRGGGRVFDGRRHRPPSGNGGDLQTRGCTHPDRRSALKLRLRCGRPRRGGTLRPRG
ncbi:MAG: aminotransferase class I/II-fold pyridoxal phosphate-dependent enzyme [Acidobacteria bacterium]|nr:aminotransferase class I/II-fold pyridoxal phosphate-dependent enzyme [Acidobacteriota bacterium]